LNGKDFYKTLGVGKGATEKEIKNAYRKIARENHPDAKPGDKAAEEKFKVAAEAYEVLSDSEKRKQYDSGEMFGGMGGPGPGGGRSYNFRAEDLGDLGDLFNLFGGMGAGSPGTGGGRRRAPRKGSDTQANTQISFEDSLRGVSLPLNMAGRVVCPACKGSGAKPGTLPRTCNTCRGRGTVSQDQGPFAFSRACPECGGQGTVIDEPCQTCRGSGSVQEARKISVKIPAGVKDGSSIRFAGRGEMGPPGGAPGDLYVKVKVTPHKFFRRVDNDIYMDLPLTLSEAALGTSVEIPTPLDGRVKLKVPAGTQEGRKFRLKGKGAPMTRGKGSGNMYAVARIMVPKKLSSEEKELLEKLRELEKENPRQYLEE
jgi:molecular chaperone DnaJ